MIVKKIEWLSREAEEALVLISDEIYECWTFSQPCCCAVGDNISMLYTLNSRGIVMTAGKQPSLSKHSNDFGYDATGVVVEKGKGIIAIGSIIVKIDGVIPGDINDGEYVNFSCSRIDL